MTTRSSLVIIALATSLVQWPSLESQAEDGPERPNVVVIVADDMGYDRLRKGRLATALWDRYARDNGVILSDAGPFADR